MLNLFCVLLRRHSIKMNSLAKLTVYKIKLYEQHKTRFRVDGLKPKLRMLFSSLHKTKISIQSLE